MRSVITFLASLAAAPMAFAQGAPVAPSHGDSPASVLSPGSRVRLLVTRPDARSADSHDVVTGTLVRIDADSIAVRHLDQLVAVPRQRVARLERHTGARSHGKSALRGAGFGALSGFVGGAAIAAAAWKPCTAGDFFCTTRSEDAVLGGVLLGGVGTIVGAAIGAAHGGDQWKPVALEAETRVGLVLKPQGVGLALRF